MQTILKARPEKAKNHGQEMKHCSIERESGKTNGSLDFGLYFAAGAGDDDGDAHCTSLHSPSSSLNLSLLMEMPEKSFG